MIEKLADERHRIPGGYDHHHHPIGFAPYQEALNIEGYTDKAEVMELISGAISLRKTKVLLIIGWNNAKINITQDDLNRFIDPIVLVNVSYHGLLLNRAAERVYGLPKSNIEGQEGNGIYVEKAAEIVKLEIAQDKEAIRNGLLKIQDELLSLGITATNELYLQTIEQLEVYLELLKSGQLKLRIPNLYGTIDLVRILYQQHPDLARYVNGLKVIMDGAFGMHTAALLDPYLDQSKNYGMLLYSGVEAAKVIQEGLKLGIIDVAVHCIGDRAIAWAIGAFNILHNQGLNTSGYSLEHAELITKKWAVEAKELRLTLGMQPNFRSDCFDYKDRLGTRVNRINPFRMLADEVGFEPGRDLFLGSDGMPPGLIHGLCCAVNGYTPAQSLTKDEAIAGYTKARRDNGDYAVLSNDPFDKDTRVLETYINHELVYKAP